MQTSRGCGRKLSIAAGGTYTAGTPIMLSLDDIAIPYTDATSGETVAVETTGEHALPKVSGAISSTPHTAAETIALGDRLFWDDTNKVLTLKALGPLVGFASQAAASSDTTVRVRLREGRLGPTGWAVAYFDASAGKATGTHTTTIGTQVPAGAVINRYFYMVITTFTSATDAATIALGHADDDDCIKTAVAISNGANPWDQGAVQGSAAATAVTTAARSLSVKVATEALTAGKIVIFVEYLKVGTWA